MFASRAKFFQLLSVLGFLNSTAQAVPKFTSTGPVLSLTLRDPFASPSTSSSSSSSSSSSTGSASGLNVSPGYSDSTLLVTSLSNLDPCCNWSIHSNGPPFPVKVPFIQSISASLVYQYNQLKAFPNSITGKINLGGFLQDRLKIQLFPSVKVKSGQVDLAISASTENDDHMGCVQMSNKGGVFLKQIRTSHKFHWPFAAMNSVTVAPSYDFQKGIPSCILSGVTGSGRTAAIVDLNMDDPTLSVSHAVDDCNILSPELSLYSAKIMYYWDFKLNSGSIRTKIDPTSSIHITWTDKTNNGEWVTDFRLPLVGVGGPLAADIKVRRQIIF